MKRPIILLSFFLLILTACNLIPNANDEPVLIPIQDAIEKGFPIYLPSSSLLQSMGISSSPTATITRESKHCTYLVVDYSYGDNQHFLDDEEPAISMLVSDGCAYPDWRGYYTELSWAEEGAAIRVGDDFVDELPPVIIFNEPAQHFQYVVFSNESLDETMKLLESMILIIAQ